MTKRPNAQAFLAALKPGAEAEDLPPPRVQAPALAEAPAAQEAVTPEPSASVHALRKKPRAAKPHGKAEKAPRSELMHFGGYLDSETFEKIALLRLRLKMDNSDLITLAIEDLFRKHNAKRAFGDA